MLKQTVDDIILNPNEYHKEKTQSSDMVSYLKRPSQVKCDDYGTVVVLDS